MDIGKGKENSRCKKKLEQCTLLPGKPPEGSKNSKGLSQPQVTQNSDSASYYLCDHGQDA